MPSISEISTYGWLLSKSNSSAILIDRTELLKDGYDEFFPTTPIIDLSFNILQATRTRISKTEFISCPSCGRTQFDLQERIKLYGNNKISELHNICVEFDAEKLNNENFQVLVNLSEMLNEVLKFPDL